MKKIFFVIGIIFVIGGLGLGVYFAWLKSKEILTPPPYAGERPAVSASGGSVAAGGSGTQSVGQFRILTSEPIFDYWHATSSVIYYLTKSGVIYRLPSGGNPEEVMKLDRNDFRGLKSDAEAKNIILSYGSNSEPKFELINLAAKSRETITGALAVSFSPDGKRFAYLQRKAGSEAMNLILKNIDGKKISSAAVSSFFVNDFDMDWIQSNQIIFSSKPSGKYDGQIWSLDLRNQKFALLGEGSGAMSLWSPDGKIGILWRAFPNRTYQADLIQDDGVVRYTLDFAAFPPKCAFSGSRAYCAVIQSYSSAAEPTLPDDYLKKAVYSSDAIYALDTVTDTLTPVFTDAEPIVDAINLKVSAGSLFFINRYDGRLYSIALTDN